MRHRGIARDLAQRLEHDVFHHGHRHGIEAHGRGELRADDAAFPEAAFDSAREAVVVRHVGAHHRYRGVVHHATHEGRASVHGAQRLVARAAEVHDEPVALLDGRDVDADRLGGVGDVVYERLNLHRAVRPGLDDLPGAHFGAVADAFECIQHGFLAVRFHRVIEAPDADAPERACLRLQVAQHELRRACVGTQELDDFLVQDTLAHELHRQYRQPLAEQIACYRVPGAGRLSPDVHLVAHTGAERDDLLAGEDGHDNDHVARMGATGVVRVVREEAVALAHVLNVVELEHAPHAIRVRAEVRRQGRMLADDVALAVGDACGEVVGLADYG